MKPKKEDMNFLLESKGKKYNLDEDEGNGRQVKQDALTAEDIK